MISTRVRRRFRRPQGRVARTAPLTAPPSEASRSDERSTRIAPNDPLIAFLQSAPGAVDLDRLELDTPGVRALREAGVTLVVPLVSQGELLGILNLGPRLSEQDYNADDRRLLENLAGQVAPALRVAQLVRDQQEQVRTRERYEQELKVATLIQQNFLPRHAPKPPGFRFDAFYRPAREVGGDFYDFIELDDGRIGIICGDVTDKGVPAALVMASTRSVLRGAAKRGLAPGMVLDRVNDLICPEMPAKMFVTCLYGILDPATGRFVFANAGHDLPYKLCAGGRVEELRARGMPLGLMEGMSYEEAEATIEPGETVLFSSDGLVEAHDPEGDMFGCPRVIELCGRHGGGAGLMDHLLEELHRFTGPEWVQEDDITMVTIHRSGESPVPEQVLAEFEVPSELGNERQVMDRVADAVGDRLTPARLDRLRTATSEAAMNAIEHGNEARAELPVAVRVSATEQAVTVRIVDHGGGKEIPESTEPDIDKKLAGEQTPRGWGLFLIKNMVDDMRVTSDDVHHTVELVLNVAEPETEEGP